MNEINAVDEIDLEDEAPLPLWSAPFMLGLGGAIIGVGFALLVFGPLALSGVISAKVLGLIICKWGGGFALPLMLAGVLFVVLSVVFSWVTDMMSKKHEA